MTSRTLVFGAAICTIAAAPITQGCATRGYVNDRIDELEQANRRAIREETETLRNSTEEARLRASTAFDSAEEARALALGRAGYEEVQRYQVFFGFDSAEIEADQAATLDAAAAEIARQPEVLVDVYGFADPTGTDRYNLGLGERRAMEVVRYLAERAPAQLSRYAAVSYGERELRGMAADARDAARNRRVVVSLIKRIPLDEMGAPTAQELSDP